MATVNCNNPEPLERFYFFQKNQVLTACQLNQLVAHFDSEDRLTRINTIGSGIIWGLNVSLDANNLTICISKGVAITSSGDLVHLENDVNLNYLNLIQDKDTMEKDGKRIIRLQNETETVPLWQLSEKSSGDKVSIKQFLEQNNPGDFVVTLLIDSYKSDPGACDQVNCDNKGILQVNDLIFLLIRKASLPLPGYNPYIFRELKPVAITHVDLGTNIISSLQNLIERYGTAIDKSLPEIQDRISIIQNDFKNITALAQPGNGITEKWSATIKEICNNRNSGEIQYCFSFLRDLAETLNEFRESLTDYYSTHCMQQDAFPKYVMAGELLSASENQFTRYRNRFKHVPVWDNPGLMLCKPAFILKKIDLMIKCFSLPSEILKAGPQEILITPSLNPEMPLEDRAIPVYYRLSQELPLHEYWSFSKNQKGLNDWNQGYLMRGISNEDSVKHPFQYDISKYSFFRIEGAFGKPVEDAAGKIEDMIRQKNLGFRVETIQIESDLTTIFPRKKFNFPELNVLFNHYRETLTGNLKLIKEYNNSLTSQLSQVNKDDFKNVQDADSSDALTNMNEALTNTKAAFNSNAETVMSKLNKPLSEFENDIDSFRKEYNETTMQGHLIESKVGYSKQSVTTSPIQKLTIDNNFNHFERIVDRYRSLKDLVLKRYIFDNFYNSNPGLIHLGGAPSGGTFVLVYSGPKKLVVGDFTLPYLIREDDIHEGDLPGLPVLPQNGMVFSNDFKDRFKWLDRLSPVPTPRIPDLKSKFGELMKSKEFTDNLKSDVLGDFVQKGSLDEYAKKSDVNNAASDVFNSKYIDMIVSKSQSASIPASQNQASVLLDNLKDDPDKFELQQLASSAEELKYLKDKDPSTLNDEDKKKVSELEGKVKSGLESTVGKIASATGTNILTKTEIVNIIASSAKDKIDLKNVADSAEKQLNTSEISKDKTRADALKKLIKTIKG